MKKYFSVGEAAKAVHTTSETLRHYDRIRISEAEQKRRMDQLSLLYRTGHCSVEYGTGLYSLWTCPCRR